MAHPRWRWLSGYLTAALLIVVLAGCSGPGGPRSSPSSGPGSVSGSASPGSDAGTGSSTSDRGVEGQLAGPGLLALYCNGSELELRRIDVGSGRMLGRRALPADTAFGGPNCLGVPDWVPLRALLDRTGSRVAAERSFQTDGATHVGYVDLSTGRFTDLSEAGGGGFSDAITSDSKPVFSPNDGQLWFVSGSTLTSVNVDTGIRTVRGNAPGGSRFYFSVAAESDLPVLGDRLPDPSGKTAVGAVTTRGIELFPGADMVDKNATPQYVGDLDQECVPSGWVSNTVLLCEQTGINEPPPPLLMDITGKVPTVTAIPENPRWNKGFVADPKTGHIVFLSTLGTSQSLYRADAQRPGDQPVKVMDIEDSTSQSSLIRLISLTD